MEFLQQAFADKVNLDDTYGALVTEANCVCLNIVADRDILATHDSVPFTLLMAQSSFGKV